LVVKRALLEESFRRGFLQRAGARELLAIDVHRTDKLFEFFVRAGWVNDVGGGGGGGDGGGVLGGGAIGAAAGVAGSR
jgi:hypothetical protein